MTTKRRFVNKKLLLTVDIERPIVAINSNYEKVATSFNVIATNVKCFPGNPSGRQKVESFGLDPLKTKIFFFEYGQDIKERDIIIYDNRRYAVKYISKPGLSDHHIEAFADTVSGG